MPVVESPRLGKMLARGALFDRKTGQRAGLRLGFCFLQLQRSTIPPGSAAHASSVGGRGKGAPAQPAAAAVAQPSGTPGALAPPPEEALAESEEAELENQIFGPYQPYLVLKEVAVVAVGQTTRDTMKPLGEPRGLKGFASVTLEVPEQDLNKALRLAFSKTEVILVYRPKPPAGATG